MITVINGGRKGTIESTLTTPNEESAKLPSATPERLVAHTEARKIAERAIGAMGEPDALRMISSMVTSALTGSKDRSFITAVCTEIAKVATSKAVQEAAKRGITSLSTGDEQPSSLVIRQFGRTRSS